MADISEYIEPWFPFPTWDDFIMNLYNAIPALILTIVTVVIMYKFFRKLINGK